MTLHSRTGFTLIELSLVLVIIGLLVSGTLAGRELIEAARMRRVHSEVQEIITGVMAFRVKYDCLPGDCAKAETFFPRNGEYCQNNNTAYAPTSTCNGNGDGEIVG